MRRMDFVSIALVAAVAVGCNKGTDRKETASAPAVGTSGEAVSSRDQDSVRDAVIANMAEVELGRLATERSTNAEVKKFAQMMIDDHTKALTKLKTLASQHNIPVPTELDEKHRDLRDKLAKLQGAEFDREYMSAMVDGHEDFVDKLESRIDKNNLAEWKAEMADRLAGKKVVERGQLTAVLPEKSDNPVTMSINQWAADTYPVAQAHLEAAKALDSAVRKRRTTN